MSAAVPLDVLTPIFGHHRLQYRLRVLALVCRRWRLGVLRSIHHLPLSLSWNTIGVGFLRMLPSLTSISCWHGDLQSGYMHVATTVPMKLRTETTDFDCCAGHFCPSKLESRSSITSLGLSLSRVRCAFTVLSECSSSLRRLAIMQSSADLSIGHIYLALMGMHLPQLVDLTLTAEFTLIDATNTSRSSLGQLVSRHASQLRTLTLRDFFGYTIDDFPNLTELSIDYPLSEERVLEWVRHAPRLVDLSLNQLGNGGFLPRHAFFSQIGHLLVHLSGAISNDKLSSFEPLTRLRTLRPNSTPLDAFSDSTFPCLFNFKSSYRGVKLLTLHRFSTIRHLVLQLPGPSYREIRFSLPHLESFALEMGNKQQAFACPLSVNMSFIYEALNSCPMLHIVRPFVYFPEKTTESEVINDLNWLLAKDAAKQLSILYLCGNRRSVSMSGLATYLRSAYPWLHVEHYTMLDEDWPELGQ